MAASMGAELRRQAGYPKQGGIQNSVRQNFRKCRQKAGMLSYRVPGAGPARGECMMHCPRNDFRRAAVHLACVGAAGELSQHVAVLPRTLRPADWR